MFRFFIYMVLTSSDVLHFILSCPRNYTFNTGKYYLTTCTYYRVRIKGKACFSYMKICMIYCYYYKKYMYLVTRTLF